MPSAAKNNNLDAHGRVQSIENTIRFERTLGAKAVPVTPFHATKRTIDATEPRGDLEPLVPNWGFELLKNWPWGFSLRPLAVWGNRYR